MQAAEPMNLPYPLRGRCWFCGCVPADSQDEHAGYCVVCGFRRGKRTIMDAYVRLNRSGPSKGLPIGERSVFLLLREMKLGRVEAMHATVVAKACPIRLPDALWELGR